MRREVGKILEWEGMGIKIDIKNNSDEIKGVRAK